MCGLYCWFIDVVWCWVVWLVMGLFLFSWDNGWWWRLIWYRVMWYLDCLFLLLVYLVVMVVGFVCFWNWICDDCWCRRSGCWFVVWLWIFWLDVCCWSGGYNLLLCVVWDVLFVLWVILWWVCVEWLGDRLVWFWLWNVWVLCLLFLWCGLCWLVCWLFCVIWLVG